MNELQKSIIELQEKAERYDHIKDRYGAIADKINDAKTLLDSAISMLGIQKTHTREKLALSDELTEQYKRLEMGIELSTDSLRKEYPDMDDRRILALYMKLSKSPLVMKRRDGSRRFLYMQKPTRI